MLQMEGTDSGLLTQELQLMRCYTVSSHFIPLCICCCKEWSASHPWSNSLHTKDGSWCLCCLYAHASIATVTSTLQRIRDVSEEVYATRVEEARQLASSVDAEPRLPSREVLYQHVVLLPIVDNLLMHLITSIAQLVSRIYGARPFRFGWSTMLVSSTSILWYHFRQPSSSVRGTISFSFRFICPG